MPVILSAVSFIVGFAALGKVGSPKPISTVVVEFPLRGEWSAIHSPGHDRYTFDFVAASGPKGRYFSRSIWRLLIGRGSVEDSYSWSQPVLSPVDGVVVHVSDGWPDREKLNLVKDILNAFVFRPKIDSDFRPFAGNYIIIQSKSRFAFLAHLQCGSVSVSTGDHVERGQMIGKVGNSGNSLVPHLHFQMMDGIDPASANIIPFHFSQYETWDGSSWLHVEHRTPKKGERIRVMSTR